VEPRIARCAPKGRLPLPDHCGHVLGLPKARRGCLARFCTEASPDERAGRDPTGRRRGTAASQTGGGRHGVVHPVVHPRHGIRCCWRRFNETRSGVAQVKHDRRGPAATPCIRFLNAPTSSAGLLLRLHRRRPATTQRLVPPRPDAHHRRPARRRHRPVRAVNRRHRSSLTASSAYTQYRDQRHRAGPRRRGARGANRVVERLVVGDLPFVVGKVLTVLLERHGGRRPSPRLSVPGPQRLPRAHDGWVVDVDIGRPDRSQMVSGRQLEAVRMDEPRWKPSHVGNAARPPGQPSPSGETRERWSRRGRDHRWGRAGAVRERR
jgi:hypothetical protein